MKAIINESVEYDARVLVYDGEILVYIHYFDLWDDFNGIYNYGVYIDKCKKLKYKLIFQTFIDKYESGISLDKSLFVTDGYPCNELYNIIENLKRLREHPIQKAACIDIINNKYLFIESFDEYRQRNNPMDIIEKMFEGSVDDSGGMDVYFRDTFKTWFCN